MSAQVWMCLCTCWVYALASRRSTTRVARHIIWPSWIVASTHRIHSIHWDTTIRSLSLSLSLYAFTLKFTLSQPISTSQSSAAAAPRAAHKPRRRYLLTLCITWVQIHHFWPVHSYEHNHSLSSHATSSPGDPYLPDPNRMDPQTRSNEPHGNKRPAHKCQTRPGTTSTRRPNLNRNRTAQHNYLARTENLRVRLSGELYFHHQTATTISIAN